MSAQPTPPEVMRPYLEEAEALIEAAAARACRDHFEERHLVLIPPCAEALADAHWWFDALRAALARPTEEER